MATKVRTPKFAPSKTPRLLKFLRDILDSECHTDVINWSDKNTLEFKFIQPNQVAELYKSSSRSSKTSYSYESMTRTLRLYKSQKLVEKVPGNDGRWRFVDSSLTSVSGDNIVDIDELEKTLRVILAEGEKAFKVNSPTQSMTFTIITPEPATPITPVHSSEAITADVTKDVDFDAEQKENIEKCCEEDERFGLFLKMLHSIY